MDSLSTWLNINVLCQGKHGHDFLDVGGGIAPTHLNPPSGRRLPNKRFCGKQPLQKRLFGRPQGGKQAMSDPSVTPEPILQVCAGLWAAEALKSGVDLQLFDALAAGPQDVAALSQTLCRGVPQLRVP